MLSLQKAGKEGISTVEIGGILMFHLHKNGGETISVNNSMFYYVEIIKWHKGINLVQHLVTFADLPDQRNSISVHGTLSELQWYLASMLLSMVSKAALNVTSVDVRILYLWVAWCEWMCFVICFKINLKDSIPIAFSKCFISHLHLEEPLKWNRPCWPMMYSVYKCTLSIRCLTCSAASLFQSFIEEGQKGGQHMLPSIYFVVQFFKDSLCYWINSLFAEDCNDLLFIWPTICLSSISPSETSNWNWFIF